MNNRKLVMARTSKSLNHTSSAWLILITVVLLWGCGRLENDLNELRSIAEKVEQEVAPDSRTAEFIFTAETEDGNPVLKVETDQPEAKLRLTELLTKGGFNDQHLKFKTLPDTALGDKTVAVVTTSLANIRYEPSYRAELVTQALFGTPVKVLRKDGGWYRVQTPDNYLGWTGSSRIKRMTEEELASWKSGPNLIVLTSTEVSDKNTALPVKKLIPGSIVRLLKSENSGNYLVETPDGKQGVIPKADVQQFEKWIVKQSYSADKILETSKQLLGRPYLWGGTSTQAMDCSGFTKMVYYLNGFQLPRDASQQMKVGTIVTDQKDNWAEIGKGDFLFFGYKGKDGKPDRVVHVGIHIEDGRFINAAGEVKIESLNKEHEDFNEYRYNTFLQARNMTPGPNMEGIDQLEEVLQ